MKKIFILILLITCTLLQGITEHDLYGQFGTDHAAYVRFTKDGSMVAYVFTSYEVGKNYLGRMLVIDAVESLVFEADFEYRIRNGIMYFNPYRTLIKDTENNLLEETRGDISFLKIRLEIRSEEVYFIIENDETYKLTKLGD